MIKLGYDGRQWYAFLNKWSRFMKSSLSWPKVPYSKDNTIRSHPTMVNAVNSIGTFFRPSPTLPEYVETINRIKEKKLDFFIRQIETSQDCTNFLMEMTLLHSIRCIYAVYVVKLPPMFILKWICILICSHLHISNGWDMLLLMQKTNR